MKFPVLSKKRSVADNLLSTTGFTARPIDDRNVLVILEHDGERAKHLLFSFLKKFNRKKPDAHCKIKID